MGGKLERGGRGVKNDPNKSDIIYGRPLCNKTTSLLQSSDKYGILGQWNELINCILDANGLPLNTTAVVNLAGQNVLDYFHRWTDNFKAKVYDSRIESAKAFKKAIEKCDPEKRPKVFVQVR